MVVFSCFGLRYQSGLKSENKSKWYCNDCRTGTHAAQKKKKKSREVGGRAAVLFDLGSGGHILGCLLVERASRRSVDGLGRVEVRERPHDVLGLSGVPPRCTRRASVALCPLPPSLWWGVRQHCTTFPARPPSGLFSDCALGGCLPACLGRWPR